MKYYYFSFLFGKTITTFIKFIFFILIVSVGCNKIEKFRDISYEELSKHILELKGAFAEHSTATSQFQLSPVEMDQGSKSCSADILSISRGKFYESDTSRPQVLINGEIHGDERVGPLTTVVLSQLLVWSAQCVIEKNERVCSKLIGVVTKAEIGWLAFLATRRETIVVPTANCMGYMTNRRNDLNVDPNRDFPYSRKDDKCLQSTTARIFHQLMLRNAIQLVVTFHGGMVALGYEWGTFHHKKPKDASPDEYANRNLGTLMGTAAGTFPGEEPYPVGRINSLIYPVDGGMEDWLYAAGWDRSALHKCKDIAPGSDYSTAPDNRALVFLVETSDAKKPADSSWGGPRQILDNTAADNGHIPRNVRLSLMAIDSAQPYVCLSHVGHAAATSGTVALRRSRRRVLQRFERALVGNSSEAIAALSQVAHAVGNTSNHSLLRQATPANDSVDSSSLYAPAVVSEDSSSGNQTSFAFAVDARITLEWYVGGAISVDHTFASWHLPPAPSHSFWGSNAEEVNGSKRMVIGDWTSYLEAVAPPSTVRYFDALFSGSDAGGGSTLRARVAKHLSERRHHHHRVDLRSVFPVIASTEQQGLSRWHLPNAPQESPGSEGRAAGAYDYTADDPMRPMSRYTATVAPGFVLMPNGSLTEPIPLLHAHEAETLRRQSESRNLSDLHAPMYSFPAGTYWLVLWAVVDQVYGSGGQGEPHHLSPQSHYANLRTNDEWRSNQSEHTSRVLQGRRYWPSEPVEVRVHADGSFAVQAHTLHCAWWERSGAEMASSAYWNPFEESSEESLLEEDHVRMHRRQRYLFYLLLVMLVLSLAVLLCSYLRKKRIYSSLLNHKYINMSYLRSTDPITDKLKGGKPLRRGQTV